MPPVAPPKTPAPPTADEVCPGFPADGDIDDSGLAPGASNAAFANVGGDGTIHVEWVFSRDGRALVVDDAPDHATRLTVFLRNGTPDLAFGAGGVMTFSMPNPLMNVFIGGARLEDEDRALLLYGSVAKPSDGSVFSPVIARIKCGALDASFGTGGVWSLPDTPARADSVFTERDAAGKVTGYFVTVSVYQRPSVAPEDRLYRLTTNGALDTAFGTGGVIALSLDGWSFTSDAKHRPLLTSRNKAIAVRLVTRSGLDPSYGGAGTATIAGDPGATYYGATFLPSPDGSTLVFADAGERKGWFSRLDAAGAAIDAFPGEPTRHLTAGGIVAGSASDGSTYLALLDGPGPVFAEHLVRWKPDGSTDTTYSVDLAAIHGDGNGVGTIHVRPSGGVDLVTYVPAPVGGNTVHWTLHHLAN
jgi:hypothetical protein